MQDCYYISYICYFASYIEVILQIFFQKIIVKHITKRSSHQGCSVKKGVLRNFAKFTGKHLCQNLFFLIKLQASACNSIKKEALAQSCPVNFAKFLSTPFYRTPPGDCFCHGCHMNVLCAPSIVHKHIHGQQ